MTQLAHDGVPPRLRDHDGWRNDASVNRSSEGAAMFRVDVFTTGGTIASTPNPTGGSSPSLSGAAILDGIDTSDLDVRVRGRLPLPSSWMSIQDIIDLAHEIDEAAANGADAALVIQGTDTLEETGFILELARRSAIPVALTGAMRTPASQGADGPANIAAALVYLPHAAANTTVVVMNDEVHPARHVRKTHTVLTNAFQSAPFGPLGIVVESNYLPYRQAIPLAREHVAVVRATAAPILLVTGVLGDDFTWLPAVIDRFSGVVVDALGAGHVSQDAARTFELIAGRVPLIVTSRTQGAPLPVDTYTYEGSERFFREVGAILSGGLDALRARLLLGLVVDDDLEATRQRYREIERHLVPGLSAHHR